MDPGTGSVGRLSASSRSERGYVIAALAASSTSPALPACARELLGSLRPAARLVIDSPGELRRRQRPRRLGGHRAPRRAARRVLAPGRADRCGDKVLRITRLHRQLDISPTVRAAVTSPGRGQRRADGKAAAGERQRHHQHGAHRAGPARRRRC